MNPGSVVQLFGTVLQCSVFIGPCCFGPRYTIPLEPSNSFEGSSPAASPPAGEAATNFRSGHAMVVQTGGGNDMYVTIAVSPDESQEAWRGSCALWKAFCVQGAKVEEKVDTAGAEAADDTGWA